MSLRIDSSIEIAASPQEVWQVIMDPMRLGDWVSIHRSVDDPPPAPLQRGSSFCQRLALAGREFGVTWTVAEVDENRCCVWRGRGPAGSRACVRYGLAPRGGHTRFEYTNEYELPGGLLGAVVGRVAGAAVVRREMNRSLARLRKLLGQPRVAAA